MRILHTSDWHLGAHNQTHSRAADHQLFFDWLIHELGARKIDVLVVAGDIFDHLQPSAEAQRRYYRFLARVGTSGVGQVLIVGGNHDSASRLDAPATLLDALQISVVGGIQSFDDALARCVIPLKNRAGDVAAVALAVPYVHEFRLGVRTTDPDPALVRAAFTERFTTLYKRLADRAQAAHPNLPLLATGHLTMGAATAEDYPQQIHRVGTIDALPDGILDPRIQYTALGHIHRSYPVGATRRAWYSGSPIALSLPESRLGRRVLQVELTPEVHGSAAVDIVNVPCFRGLRAIRGTPEALEEELRGLTWQEPLPPLLFCTAITERRADDLDGRLRQLLRETFGSTFGSTGGPVLAELRLAHPNAELNRIDDEDPDANAASLTELGPAEVFDTLCVARGVTERERLQGAFASLLSLNQEDLDDLVKQISKADQGAEA